MRFFTLITFIAVSSLAVLASEFPQTLRENQDLQFIHKFQRDQKAAAAASALNLSPEQAATLRSIKADAEAVKASFAPRFAALEQRTTTLAAEVRARVESSGSLSEQDQAALKALRTEFAELKREQGEQMQTATAGLEHLLSDEQVATLRERAQERRSEMRQRIRERRPERGEDGVRVQRQHGESFKHAFKERRHERKGRKVARILLSDAFIEAIEP